VDGKPARRLIREREALEGRRKTFPVRMEKKREVSWQKPAGKEKETDGDRFCVGEAKERPNKPQGGRSVISESRQPNK
jgi:hypothetical protein